MGASVSENQLSTALLLTIGLTLYSSNVSGINLSKPICKSILTKRTKQPTTYHTCITTVDVIKKTLFHKIVTSNNKDILNGEVLPKNFKSYFE